MWRTRSHKVIVAAKKQFCQDCLVIMKYRETHMGIDRRSPNGKWYCSRICLVCAAWFGGQGLRG